MLKRLAKTLVPTIAVAAMSVALVPAPEALAQSDNKAEALNTKGKELFKERRYLEAYRAFKQATELNPQGRYYFNLCFSLNYLERFQEAIDACEQVQPNGADEKLRKKTEAVLGALRAKVPAKPTPDPVDPNPVDPNNPDPNPPVDPNNPNPVDPNNPNPVDPNNPDPNNTTDPNAANNASTGPATVPGFDPFAVKKAPSGYEWALGASAAPLTNLGLGAGENGIPDAYGAGGFRFNLFGDFMYRQASRIGLQGFFGFTTITPDFVEDSLTMLDFGGAAYKHIKLANNLDLTPLVGAYVSLLQPEPDTSEALIAVGARAQVSVDYALGPNKEHVLSFAPSLNLYSAASDSNTVMAESFGLDTGGATLEFSLGYKYRFTTPFGASPLFTLE